MDSECTHSVGSDITDSQIDSGITDGNSDSESKSEAMDIDDGYQNDRVDNTPLDSECAQTENHPADAEHDDAGQVAAVSSSNTQDEAAGNRFPFFSGLVDRFSWFVNRRSSEKRNEATCEENASNATGTTTSTESVQQAESPPSPTAPTVIAADRATQTSMSDDDFHRGNGNSFADFLHKLIGRTQHINREAVDTAEKACQTDEELSQEEFQCITDENDAARVTVHSASKIINFTKSSVTNKNVMDKVLQKHQEPLIVKEVIINGKYCLCDIPVTIGMFRNLVVLNLRDNAIARLPWTMALLEKLKTLDLSYNLLQRLPRVIGSISSLRHLNLEANQLQYLPTELVQLKNLESINVLKNKRLKSPPVAACNKGVEALFLELGKRSERNNLWQNLSAKMNNPLKVQSLEELCTEAVISHKVEFLVWPTIPPSVKVYLSGMAEDDAIKVDVAKCSSCQKFYSCKEMFDNHSCGKK